MDSLNACPYLGGWWGFAPLQECIKVFNVVLWGPLANISKRRQCREDAEDAFSTAPSGGAPLGLQNGSEATVQERAGPVVVAGDSHEFNCIHEGCCTVVYVLRGCGGCGHRSTRKVARLRFSVAAAGTDLVSRFLNHGVEQVPLRLFERV